MKFKLVETIKRLSNTAPRGEGDVYITYSIIDVFNFCQKAPQDVRIFYDAKSGLYMMGLADNCIHNELFQTAWDEGYIPHDWREHNDIWNYMDDNDVYYIIYSKKDNFGSFEHYKFDGYDKQYKMKYKMDGVFVSRHSDLMDTPFKEYILDSSPT